MADTSAILHQRFLENEGELGRNFTKVFNRFTEFHQAIATGAAGTQANVVAPVATPPAPTAAPTAALDVLESLMRELDAYEYGMQHSKLIQASSLREMSTYESRESEIAARIQSTQISLVTLQKELDQTRARRRELEEYEALTKKIQTLPSRADTIAAIGKLKENELAMQRDSVALLADLRAKHTKFKDVLTSMDTLSGEWTVDDAMERAEALIEQQRAAEEEAMREAAMEAKLAQQQEQGQEPEQEREKEDHDEPSNEDEEKHAQGGEGEEGASTKESGEVTGEDTNMEDVHGGGESNQTTGDAHATDVEAPQTDGRTTPAPEVSAREPTPTPMDDSQ